MKTTDYAIEWKDGRKWVSEGRDSTLSQAKRAVLSLKKYPSLANKKFRLIRVTTTREVVK